MESGKWKYGKGWGFIVLAFLISPFSPLEAHTDSIAHFQPEMRDRVYQGMTIKYDLGATVVALAISKAQLQHYELAMNWRLINRLYPTFEAGYAGGARTQGDTISYLGHGGFFRVGLDINPLKKSAADSPHALLVGVRLGSAFQQYSEDLVRPDTDFRARVTGGRADCWGEIVAGCQVQVAKNKKSEVEGGFYMGWMGRLKFLFTRSKATNDREMMSEPIYIPGFGNRDNIGWGVSYHIGWKF